MKRFILCVVCLIPLWLVAQETLRLPAILSNHMVLQQNDEVRLWGWCNPRTEVHIVTSWSDDTISVTTTNKASWETIIKTPNSGDPHQIKVFTKDEEIIISDVMLGELWICSGQSNMEYSANHGVVDMKEALEESQNSEIRLFYVEKATADYPQEDLKGSWKVCDAESLSSFSAVGYFFGQKLNSDLKVPIGLINSNWGGTPVETWTPEESIENEEVVASNKYLKFSTGWDTQIGSTYNAMIHPITKMNVTGVIWYQGESNTPNAYLYSESFITMIRSWRERFDKNLPFYYVQIAPYERYPVPYSAAVIREQQEQAMKLNDVGMVVISDQVDDIRNIHPSYKKQVGYRLANYALAETYGVDTPKYKFATFKDQMIEGKKIKVAFNNVRKGLEYHGSEIEGLEIAGEGLTFYKAKGEVTHDNSLVIYSKQIKKPKYVRYAFGNGIIGNLFDKSGLPVAPFRTDSIVYDLKPNIDN